jgi:hypothetical protein
VASLAEVYTPGYVEIKTSQHPVVASILNGRHKKAAGILSIPAASEKPALNRADQFRIDVV